MKPDYPIDGRSLLPLINKEVSKVRDFSVSEGGFLLSEELIIEYATFPYDLKAQIQHDYVEYVGRVVALRDHNFTFVYRLYKQTNFIQGGMIHKNYTTRWMINTILKKFPTLNSFC